MFVFSLVFVVEFDCSIKLIGMHVMSVANAIMLNNCWIQIAVQLFSVTG